MVRKYRQISQEEAKQIMDSEEGYILLDVRTQEEYDEKHIPGAICVPVETIGDDPVPELPDKSQLILIYCRSGNRSVQAAEKLFLLGYSNLAEFGGINTWTGPVISSEEENLVKTILMLDQSEKAEKDGITLEVTEYSKGTITAELTNNSGNPFVYGDAYLLKYNENGEWVNIGPDEDAVWNSMEKELPDKETVTFTVPVGEDPKTGEYMLVKEGIETTFWLVMSE